MNTTKWDIPAYTISLENDLELRVKTSANAWWRDRLKVSMLLAAFSVGFSFKNACEHAGITEKQYKYFAATHPQITEIRSLYKQKLLSRSRATIEKEISNNPRFALKFLNKTKPEEFPPPRLLNRIKYLEEYIEETASKHKEEVRSLKIIIGMFKEIATANPTKDWHRKFIKRTNILVATHNRIYGRELMQKTPDIVKIKEEAAGHANHKNTLIALN